jgi:formiminoglutamase
MFNSNYKVSDKILWQGRIDSEYNYDAFRWHQLVKFIDLRNEDTKQFEGKLGFAFIGFCCDEGIRRNKGRTGAAEGPDSIRKELAPLPCWFSKQVELFDAGNIYCEDITLEESQALLSRAVEKVLSLNLFPIVLGGGHEVAFGNYMGILDYLRSDEQKPNIGIINFDAHFDIRPYENGASSGTMFRQIADSCEQQGLKYSYLCIGVEKHSNTVDLFKTADKLGIKYIKASEITNGDYSSLLQQVDKFIDEQDSIYLTVCSDVFSTANAPGVSAPQALGLDPKVVLRILEHILRTGKAISFDIAEVSPKYDRDNMTADLASMAIFSVVNTLSEIVI